MPFDGTFPIVMRRSLFDRLLDITNKFGRYNRTQELAHLLRHKELWPVGFVWHYQRPESCAIGLARQHWRLGRTGMRNFSRQLGIPQPVATRIFLNLALYSHVRMDKITPERVADALDAYLAQKGG